MENILRNMLPAAEKRMLPDGSIQFHWEADGRENSITIFSPENAAKMREFTKNCNDIAWVGDIRFASTI